MRTAKVAVSIEKNTLQQIDRLVKEKVFSNRSKAFQGAIEDKLARMNHNRLARECSKLDPKFEKAMAEEGMSLEIEKWPEY